jgi:hypothetical protein
MRRLLVVLALLGMLVATSATAATPRLKTVRAGAYSIGTPLTWKARSRVGPSRLVVFAPRAQGGILSNAALLTGPAGATVSRAQWAAGLVTLFRRLHIRITKPRVRTVTLPAGRAYESTYGVTVAGKKMRSISYAFRSGNRLYLTTFTAAAKMFPGQLALFRRMAHSIRIRR